MTKIHMETEQVEQLATRMTQQSQTMQESANLIFRQLEGASWQGGSRDEYMMQLADCRQRLIQYGEKMQALQAALRAEEAQWLEAAAVFGSGTPGQASIISDAFQGFWGSIVSPFRTMDFRSAWKNASLEERKKMAIAFQTFIIGSYGIPVSLEVIDIEDPIGKDAQGYYDPVTGVVTIDIDNLMSNNPLEVLNTVAHETRHSVQHYLVNHPEERPKEMSEEKVNAWKENFENYLTPEDDFEGYRKQPVEKDARDFAAQAVNNFLQKGIGFEEVKSAVQGGEK
jgi:uncharacterized protein YukE